MLLLFCQLLHYCVSGFLFVCLRRAKKLLGVLVLIFNLKKKKKIQKILSNVKITFRGESYLFYIIFIGEKQSKEKF